MNKFVEGNYEDKYNTKNPISKLLMRNFFASLNDLLSEIEKSEINTVCEVGVGEGVLLNNLIVEFPNARYWANDLSKGEIRKAKNRFKDVKNINFSVQNAENLSEFKDRQFDLVICCEVLEHISNYKKAIKELKRISKKYVLVSVPNEPIWRILNMVRGKYLSNLGNTPGHLNHWTKLAFVEFVSKDNLKIIDKKFPLPWQMLLLRID